MESWVVMLTVFFLFAILLYNKAWASVKVIDESVNLLVNCF